MKVGMKADPPIERKMTGQGNFRYQHAAKLIEACKIQRVKPSN